MNQQHIVLRSLAGAAVYDFGRCARCRTAYATEILCGSCLRYVDATASEKRRMLLPQAVGEDVLSAYA